MSRHGDLGDPKGVLGTMHREVSQVRCLALATTSWPFGVCWSIGLDPGLEMGQQKAMQKHWVKTPTGDSSSALREKS